MLCIILENSDLDNLENRKKKTNQMQQLTSVEVSGSLYCAVLYYDFFAHLKCQYA